MKTIQVIYWKQSNLIDSLIHNSFFDYSIEKRNEIIQTVIDHNLSLMIRPNMGLDGHTLVIYIDKGRFVQS